MITFQIWLLNPEMSLILFKNLSHETKFLQVTAFIYTSHRMLKSSLICEFWENADGNFITFHNWQLEGNQN